MQELKDASSKPQFSSLDPIRASDFAEHVTEGSKDHWVVLLLHQEKCVAHRHASVGEDTSAMLKLACCAAPSVVSLWRASFCSECPS